MCIRDRSGIELSSITLDPGFGFGKNLGHNIALLKNLSEFHEFGVSILAGLSRKSMIGTLLGDKDVDSRMIGSVTAAFSTIDLACSIARSESKNLPPSEKESGVTLRTPIMIGSL